MKCNTCGKKVETTFLNKLVGTYVKDSKGKRKAVCSACQKQEQSKSKKKTTKP